MPERFPGLTEKEKETLRLIVRGHDAKSMARELGLSVHTINERLRATRRKLEVTSSKEAARVLFEEEGTADNSLVSKDLGDGGNSDSYQRNPAPRSGRGGAQPTGFPRSRLIKGGVVMVVLFTALAVTVATPNTDAGQEDPRELQDDASPEILEPLEEVARDWLALVDDKNWQASFDSSADAFRNAVSAEAWRASATQAREPLGQVVERKFTEFGSVSVPPANYRLVLFKTEFAKRQGVVETVVLQEEDGEYRVSGYWVK